MRLVNRYAQLISTSLQSVKPAAISQVKSAVSPIPNTIGWALFCKNVRTVLIKTYLLQEPTLIRNFSSLGQPAANKKDKISTSNFRPPMRKGQHFKGHKGGLRLSQRSEIWHVTLGWAPKANMCEGRPSKRFCEIGPTLEHKSLKIRFWSLF